MRTKPLHVLRDASIGKQRLRLPDVPRFRTAFGEDPELGVDERSGSNRTAECLLQRSWDSHGRGDDACGGCLN